MENQTQIHSQQTRSIACQGEGESAVNSGYSEGGKSDEYPSVDTPKKKRRAKKLPVDVSIVKYLQGEQDG